MKTLCTRSRLLTRINFPLDWLFIRAVASAMLPTQRGPVRQPAARALPRAGAAEKGLYIAYTQSGPNTSGTSEQMVCQKRVDKRLCRQVRSVCKMLAKDVT